MTRMSRLPWNFGGGPGDLAGLGAVADRGPTGVVAALGADQPVHVGLQQACQHPQAGPHGQGVVELLEKLEIAMRLAI